MSATKEKVHAHRTYQDEVEAIIDSIAGGQAVKVVRGNTTVSRLLQQYALVRMARYKIDRVHEHIRNRVLGMFSIPDAPGQYVVYDNPQVICTAQVRSAVGRIDEGVLLDTLVSKYSIPVEQATKLLDSCRTPPVLSTEIAVVLKR